MTDSGGSFLPYGRHQIDEDDIADMIAEIRRLDPKPGLAFGAPVEPPAIPDVFVSAAPDNSWRVELNSEALPRVLVIETYAAKIKRSAKAKDNFKHLHPCPSTGKSSGPCPGYVIDHIKPLCAGGIDAPSNMQWQTLGASKAKDKLERRECSAFPK